VRLLRRGDKAPPLFILIFSNNEDLKKIYKIKEILKSK